jgi:hypothetical protein
MGALRGTPRWNGERETMGEGGSAPAWGKTFPQPNRAIDNVYSIRYTLRKESKKLELKPGKYNGG